MMKAKTYDEFINSVLDSYQSSNVNFPPPLMTSRFDALAYLYDDSNYLREVKTAVVFAVIYLMLSLNDDTVPHVTDIKRSVPVLIKQHGLEILLDQYSESDRLKITRDLMALNLL